MATPEYISRPEAKSQGLRQYFTGKPCKHGHIAPKFVSNGACVVCAKGWCENQRKKQGRSKKAVKEFPPERRSALDNGQATYHDGVPCKEGHVGEKYAKSGDCKECRKQYLRKWRAEKRAREFPDGHKPWKECAPGNKVCVDCRQELPHSSFSPDSRASDGLQPKCLECNRTRRRERYWQDPETERAKQRDYHARNPHVTKEIGRRQREGANREKILAQKREEYRRNKQDPEWQAKQYQYRQLTKDQKREYDKEYVKANREKINEQARRWRENNPEKRRAICFNDAAKRRARKEGGPSSAEVAEWASGQNKVCYWCGTKCPDNYHVDHYVPLAKGGPHILENLVIACPSCNLRKNAKDPYEFAQERGRLF